MSGMWGNNLKVAIFGESHGEGVGVTLCGIPAGLVIDEALIKTELLRRAGGHDKFSTSRLEADEYKILSGVMDNKATGAPICIFIPNTNTRSGDYEQTKNFMRPSHADYTAHIKYEGNNDYRGGGHFSARVTAAFVAAGAIAKMYLKTKGVKIGSHILSIGDIADEHFGIIVNEDILSTLENKAFAVLNDDIGLKMQETIINAKGESDSIGGVVETVAIGVPVGIGEPFFDSVESVVSHILFSIPGVKGVEFGAGFEISKMRGTTANDIFYTQNGRILTKTNNSGGINGGISNGMPIIAKIAFRPTASIGKAQSTVDISTNQNASFIIHGRHDPCIAKRGAIVTESAFAIGIADLMLQKKG